jgi:glycosyltransferase involved in cell wall biosynthesis
VRILQVLATSGGGVGRHVHDLATGLAAEGRPVVVAGPAATEATFRFGASGLTFAPVDIADRPRPRTDAAAVARLRRLARRADVVHAHGLRAGALAALAVTTLRRRPALVVTLHNALVGAGRGAVAVHRVLEGVVARRADVVLVVSGDLGAAIRERGARDVRRALVPAPSLPPATSGPDEVRSALGVPPGTRLLVTVARLAPQKGLERLADAVEVLRTRRPDLALRAVVAGDGPLGDALARDAAARDLPITFLGRRDDVADLLAAADLVVVPSLWEGQPLVVQEALRAGAAVVATDSGGVNEVTQGAAVLVQTGDPEALAEAVARLLDDPSAAADLRAHARTRAARLPTALDAVRQVIEVYTNATSKITVSGGQGAPG